MIAVALRGAGLDPGWIVGGEVRDLGANAGWSDGEWLVVEADESDRSFLALAPQIAVVTNIELDHHHTYGSQAELEEAFRAFLAGASGRRLGPPGAARRRPSARSRSFAVRRGRCATARCACPGAHNRAQRRGRAERLRAGRRRPRALPRGAERASAAPSGASRSSERPRPARASSTTTPTTRPRSPRRSPPRARRSRRGWSRCSSRISSPARASWPASSARALAAADRSLVLPVYPARERQEDFPGVGAALIAADEHPGSFEEAAGAAARRAARGRPVPGHGRRRRRPARRGCWSRAANPEAAARTSARRRVRASCAGPRRRRGRAHRGRVLAVAALGWFWLRDSPLVAVDNVTVTGVTGPDADAGARDARPTPRAT